MTGRVRSSVPDTWWPPVITATGVMLASLFLGEVVVFGIRSGSLPEGFWIGAVTSIPFLFGLVYGGCWVLDSDLPAGRYPRIAKWWSGTLVAFTAIVLGLVLVTQTVTVRLLVGTVRWAGSIGGSVGLLIGVFEAQAVERELAADRYRREQRAVAEQRDRLEEFASIVSHDLRNPLNVASQRLELAREGGEDEHLDAAVDALERMEAIIDDTLVLAREGLSVGETEPVELAALAEQSWGGLSTREADLRVEFTGTVAADGGRLRHVFENLFRNAVEHAGEDVTVRVGRLPGGFYVEDDGSGIPGDDRKTAFDPGWTTADEGTGFGLAIVRRIVEAHGWEIRIVEGERGGARFEITGVEFVRS